MDAKEETKKVLLTEPIKILIKWVLGIDIKKALAYVSAVSVVITVYVPAVYGWLKIRLPFWLLLSLVSIEFLLLLIGGLYIRDLKKKLNKFAPRTNPLSAASVDILIYLWNDERGRARQEDIYTSLSIRPVIIRSSLQELFKGRYIEVVHRNLTIPEWNEYGLTTKGINYLRDNQLIDYAQR